MSPVGPDGKPRAGELAGSSWLGLDLDSETNDVLAIACARIEAEVRKRAGLVTVTPSTFRREVKRYLEADMLDVLLESRATRVP